MIDDNRCYSGLTVAHQWLISELTVKKQRRYSSKKLIYKLPN